MSDSDSDEAPEEVTLDAGKEAVIAARRRETTGRRQVREAAKKRRAHPEKDDDAKKSSNQADHEGEEDDEVEELDLDVIEAVAGRPLGDEDEARGVGAVREKLSKKAARRAARREEAEGYLGDGVWERDGFEVMVAGDEGDNDPARGACGPAADFLKARLAGSRHKRSKAMLLDPKTGKNISTANGGPKGGAGRKRRCVR